MANFSFPWNQHPSAKTIIAGDYIGDLYSSTKFGEILPIGDLCTNGWKMKIILVMYIVS